MTSRIRVVVDWVIGIVLIAIGFVGFFVPILQGWIFVLAGLAVLSSHSRHAKALLERIKGIGKKVKQRVVGRKGSDLSA